jgi:hypothetical protein
LDGDEDVFVHHFEGGGDDAFGDDGGDGFGGVADGGEGDEGGFDTLGERGELDPGFGDDAEGAFAADDEGEEVGAGCAFGGPPRVRMSPA